MTPALGVSFIRSKINYLWSWIDEPLKNFNPLKRWWRKPIILAILLRTAWNWKKNWTDGGTPASSHPLRPITDVNTILSVYSQMQYPTSQIWSTVMNFSTSTMPCISSSIFNNKIYALFLLFWNLESKYFNHILYQRVSELFPNQITFLCYLIFWKIFWNPHKILVCLGGGAWGASWIHPCNWINIIWQWQISGS